MTRIQRVEKREGKGGGVAKRGKMGRRQGNKAVNPLGDIGVLKANPGKGKNPSIVLVLTRAAQPDLATRSVGSPAGCGPEH